MFKRIAGTLMLVAALAGPAMAQSPLPEGTPPGLELDRMMETLRQRAPEIFGVFGQNGPEGMRADQAVEVFGRVLERVRVQDAARGGQATEALNRINPEMMEGALDVLRSLGTSVSTGDLQRGRLDPAVAGALGKLVPPEAVQALQVLRLDPRQVTQLQTILLDVAPRILTGSDADLKSMEGPLRDRLRNVFTPQQLELLRKAETLQRSRPEVP